MASFFVFFFLVYLLRIMSEETRHFNVSIYWSVLTPILAELFSQIYQICAAINMGKTEKTKAILSD